MSMPSWVHRPKDQPPNSEPLDWRRKKEEKKKKWSFRLRQPVIPSKVIRDDPCREMEGWITAITEMKTWIFMFPVGRGKAKDKTPGVRQNVPVCFQGFCWRLFFPRLQWRWHTSLPRLWAQLLYSSLLLQTAQEDLPVHLNRAMNFPSLLFVLFQTEISWCPTHCVLLKGVILNFSYRGIQIFMCLSFVFPRQNRLHKLFILCDGALTDLLLSMVCCGSLGAPPFHMHPHISQHHIKTDTNFSPGKMLQWLMFTLMFLFLSFILILLVARNISSLEN